MNRDGLGCGLLKDKASGKRYVVAAGGFNGLIHLDSTEFLDLEQRDAWVNGPLLPDALHNGRLVQVTQLLNPLQLWWRRGRVIANRHGVSRFDPWCRLKIFYEIISFLTLNLLLSRVSFLFWLHSPFPLSLPLSLA